MHVLATGILAVLVVGIVVYGFEKIFTYKGRDEE